MVLGFMQSAIVSESLKKKKKKTNMVHFCLKH